MKVVYIAGPLTTGDWSTNLYLAMKCADRLANAGICPVIPHLMAYWQSACPGRTYEDMMSLCFAQLQKCDALLRLPGNSSGADREMELARGLGIPVFTSEADLMEWAKCAA